MRTSLTRNLTRLGLLAAGAITASTAVAQTSLAFTTAPTLESGSAFSNGAVYRFSNGGVVGGTQTDLLLTVLGGQAFGSAVNANTLLTNVSVTTTGHIALRLTPSTVQQTTAGLLTVEVSAQFVTAGTSTAKTITSFVAQSYDIDSSDAASLSNFTDLAAFNRDTGATFTTGAGTVLTRSDSLITTSTGNFFDYAAFSMAPTAPDTYADVNPAVDPLDLTNQAPYTVQGFYTATSSLAFVAGNLAAPTGTPTDVIRGGLSSSRSVFLAFDDFVAIPEPSTYAALIGGLALLVAARRRSSK